ncbi:hypothetical protein MTO96_051540 [Rhipicephalus appendiculatus]
MECITKKFMGIGLAFAFPQINADNIYKLVCRVLKNGLPKCVARSKINSAQCAQVDVSSIEKLMHTFVGRTVPGYNVASQACLSAAALLSIVLALAFTRLN